ncbi:MAG: sialidase family protein [Verrucomicrobiota bacterium]
MSFFHSLITAVILMFPAWGFSGLVRIANPLGGHIHPSVCVSKKRTIVVIYGHINHRDLRITRSMDGGKTWSDPKPFEHTLKKTYYPGSLTALSDGRLVHMWNRWDTPVTEKEPRSVLYSVSEDDGVTWSDPDPLPRDQKIKSIIRHPITELAPNRWLISLTDKTFIFNPENKTSQPFGDGRIHGLIPVLRTPAGTYISGAGLRSIDEGKSWVEIKDFPNLAEQGWRHEMVCLKNGWLLASEILGPGTGGEKIRYRVSRDDGQSWGGVHEYHNPGRAIGGRACPRTVQLDDKTIAVVFYDISKDQDGGGGLFFLRIPIEDLKGD